MDILKDWLDDSFRDSFEDTDEDYLFGEYLPFNIDKSTLTGDI